MTEPAPAPLTDLPLSAAVEELTGFETIAIEDHFKKDFNDLGGVKSLLGTVWAYGNRGDNTMSWNKAMAFTLKELNGLFAPEPKDAIEDDPDSDLGKESSPGETPI